MAEIFSKKVPNHYSEHLLFRWICSAQDSDLAPFFGDLSQIEKLSEIKPPLELHQSQN